MFQFTAFCLKWSRTCRGARMHCTFHSKLHSIEASRNEWNITPNVHNRLTNRAERAHLKHSFHHVCSSVFVQLNRLECVTERQCIMRWLAGRNAVHQWTTINYFGYFSSSHSIHIMMFFFGGGRVCIRMGGHLIVHFWRAGCTAAWQMYIHYLLKHEPLVI